jgi:hypothetical protein
VQKHAWKKLSKTVQVISSHQLFYAVKVLNTALVYTTPNGVFSRNLDDAKANRGV